MVMLGAWVAVLVVNVILTVVQLVIGPDLWILANVACVAASAYFVHLRWSER